MSNDLVEALRRLPSIPVGGNTWKVFVNGEELPREGIRHVLMVLEKPGRPALGLELGWIDDGKFQYDGLSHFEMAGGGIVVIPFLIWHGDLFVALINQNRFHAGGAVETVPRGYAEIGKGVAAQATAELGEELGHVAEKWASFELLGDPVNPNTSISNTSRPHPAGGRAGSRFFAREIDPECVEPDDRGKPCFKEGTVNPRDPQESILSWRLAPWFEAMRLHDACPINATGRLMAHLYAQNRLLMNFR